MPARARLAQTRGFVPAPPAPARAEEALFIDGVPMIADRLTYITRSVVYARLRLRNIYWRSCILLLVVRFRHSSDGYHGSNSSKEARRRQAPDCGSQDVRRLVAQR